MLPSLLSDIRVHGYVVPWLIVFLGGAGIPLPVDPLLLASGALAGHGDLKAAVVALVAISAAGCGDNVSYLVGRTLGSDAASWLKRSRIGRRFISPSTVERGRKYFARYGGWAIFLSRWLVGAFSGVVNLLAGMRRFPFPAFFAYALTGEALDTAIMLALGMTFGASWALANNLVKVVSFAALGLIGVTLIIVRKLYQSRNPDSGKHQTSKDSNSEFRFAIHEQSDSRFSSLAISYRHCCPSYIRIHLCHLLSWSGSRCHVSYVVRCLSGLYALCYSCRSCRCVRSIGADSSADSSPVAATTAAGL